MQFTELRPQGPKGHWLLTYSQSEDPDSKHHDDQTKLFSKSEFVPMLYTNKQIRSDPKLKITQLPREDEEEVARPVDQRRTLITAPAGTRWRILRTRSPRS